MCVPQLHGTTNHQDFLTTNIPIVNPAKPTPMLANIPFHVAAHSWIRIMARHESHARKSAVKIVFHGISHFPSVIVISPEQIVATKRISVAMKVKITIAVTLLTHICPGEYA